MDSRPPQTAAPSAQAICLAAVGLAMLGLWLSACAPPQAPPAGAPLLFGAARGAALVPQERSEARRAAAAFADGYLAFGAGESRTLPAAAPALARRLRRLATSEPWQLPGAGTSLRAIVLTPRQGARIEARLILAPPSRAAAPHIYSIACFLDRTEGGWVVVDLVGS